MPKIKEAPMPTPAENEQANDSLGRILAKAIKIAEFMKTEEHVASMQEILDGLARSFGTKIALGITFNQAVLLQFDNLRGLVADLNEDNREDNGGEDILTVRLPHFEHPFTHVVMTFDMSELKPAARGGDRSGSDSTSTGSGGSGSHDHVNSTATHGGAGGAYHHDHYQRLDGGGDDHTLHLKVAGATTDSGGCCNVM